MISTPALVLASSLPPQLRGQPFNPAAASSLQQRILASWRQAGFTPLSLHTTAELAAQPRHAERLAQAGVSVLEVHQAGLELLPNLLASLTALVASHPHALVAITNADIFFAPGTDLTLSLQTLGPDQALIGRRRNVAADAQVVYDPAGESDAFGFDFFALHAASLRKVLPMIPEGLVFGRPWWDLFLPLALLASGLELRDPGPDLFLHQSHTERWNAEQWLSYGYQADRRFLQLFREQGCEAFRRRWTVQRRRAIRRLPSLTVLRHRIREQLRSVAQRRGIQPLYLSDLSDAINALIEAELNPEPGS